MLDFAAPWWLLALTVVPLLRWLHRWRAPLSRAAVNALFLWPAAETVSAGSKSRQTPDPAWRRRAIIASLLVITLAGPGLRHDELRITVWVDDTLSMATIEQEQSRLANGLSLLRAALNESGADDVILRSISDPVKSISSEDPRAFEAGYWLSEYTLVADPPPPALMSQASEHWAITDGASLSGWDASVTLDRIIHVGSSTENAAVTRIAARRSVEQPEATDVLISVANRGHQTAQRELVLLTGTHERVVDTLVLAPGEVAHTNVVVKGSIGAPEALLRPGDALAADDVLVLDTSSFSAVPVVVDSACPSALQQAIDTHPFLRRGTQNGNPELQVLCSNKRPEAKSAIRFHVDAPVPILDSPTWLPEAGEFRNVQLRPAWISASAWPDSTRTADRSAILVAGNHELIARSSNGAIVVETVIDPAHPGFTNQPEYAAFVAGLVDIALSRPVLDPVAIAARDPLESTIAPSAMTASQGAALRQSSSATAANLFIALAMSLLIFDLAILWRARREARNA